MIYPIVAYGNPVLKQQAKDIGKDEIDLKQLIDDMFETMYQANGVGLAAPQIGKSIRVFVVDTSPGGETEEGEEPRLKQAFINPEIIEENGDDWPFEEGCLSIPKVHADVERPEEVTIHYYDEDWNEHEKTFTGMAARVIQHEYDHIEGILFTDHLTPFKKRMLKGKLTNISKGKIDVDYKMIFNSKK